MGRAALLVFVLQHGTAVSFAGLVPLWAFACWIVRHVGATVRANALRARVRALPIPLEGDFATRGVWVDGTLLRFARTPAVLGAAPCDGDRVLAWGDVENVTAEAPYRSASRALGGNVAVVKKSQLDAAPPARATLWALAFPLAVAFWAASWLAIGPWLASDLVLQPRAPAREALAQSMAGERSAVPLDLALVSPFARVKARDAIARALDANASPDSSATSDEIRALLPVLAAFSEREIGSVARVRLFLEAGQVQAAIAEGHRASDPNARELAARAALTFGSFRDSAMLTVSKNNVILAGMSGDVNLVRDVAPPGCVAVWANVRLGDATVRELHDVAVMELDPRDTSFPWTRLLCSRLLDDVSVDTINDPRIEPQMSTMWEVLREIERDPNAPVPGPFGSWPSLRDDGVSDGASPALVEQTIRRSTHDVVDAVPARSASYDERFEIPDECPANTDLRYAADVYIGRCVGRTEAVDPFVGGGIADNGRWASWWRRAFMTTCLAPDTTRSSLDGWVHSGREAQCVRPLQEQALGESKWSAWWRSYSWPCTTRFEQQPPFVELIGRLVQARSIAHCAGMNDLDARLERAIAAFRSAYDRRSTTALLWP